MKNKMGNMDNRIVENVREALTSVTTDMQQRMNQGTESKTDEVETIAIPTPGQIKPSTDIVPCDKSESFQAKIKHHSNSGHSEEDVEKPATLAVQAHATIDQGFGVSQEKCTLNSDNSGDQVEEMLFNADDLKRAGIELYGCDVYSSIPKSQEIYGDFAEIPETRIESEDVTQPCGGESFVTQLQYGAEEINQRQTTKFYDTNSDANGQHSPTVSTTTYCEDITGANPPSSTTKSPGVSSVSKSA
jgi:hypothetical protein